MNFIFLFLITFNFMITTTFCMNNPSSYQFRHAQIDDIEQLLSIINHEAIHDSNNIVILPEKFRSPCLEQDINNKKIFVATNQHNIIVGFKKLFLITSPEQQHDILNNEIRCLNKPSINHGSIELNNLMKYQEFDPTYYYNLTNTTCIYNGGDFTRVDFRHQGINQQLTDYALSSIEQKVIKHIQEHTTTALLMVYGLTQNNSGKFLTDGRTKNILASFLPFIANIKNKEHFNSNKIYMSRYHALKPSFDVKAQELQPLPDEQSVAGFGYVLEYSLFKNF